jgi:hypothetical protein
LRSLEGIGFYPEEIPFGSEVGALHPAMSEKIL